MVFTISILPFKERRATMILCSSIFSVLSHRLACCKIKWKEILMVFPTVIRSSTYHTIIHQQPSLLALFVIILLLPTEQPHKRILPQIQVIFLTSTILLFCVHVCNFTQSFCISLLCPKGYLQFLQLKVSLVFWLLLLFNHKNGFNPSTSSTPLEYLILDRGPFQLWTVNRHIKFPLFVLRQIIHSQKAPLTFPVLIRGDLDCFHAALHPVYLTGSQAAHLYFTPI